ncbi:MAG: RlmE family RNA methyltransferase [Methanobacteriaceae archaeon]
MGSRWQVEKKKEHYYKKAKESEYRSRASFKLLQLDKKYKIIKEGEKIVDLGAAPGGWSQVALEKVGETGKVVAIDLNKIKPFTEENLYKMQGDFTSTEAQEEIIRYLEGYADVVMSDASPKLTGIKDIDKLRSTDLAQGVLDINKKILKNNGNMVIKVFQGSEYKELLDKIKKEFRSVKTTKPSSSRKKSTEMYVIGLKYKRRT